MLRKHFIARLRSRSEKSSSRTKYWEQSCQFSGSGISWFCPLSLFARKGVASMPKSDAYTSTEKSSLDEVAMSNDDLLSWRVKNCKRSRSEKSSSETKYWEQSCGMIHASFQVLGYHCFVLFLCLLERVLHLCLNLTLIQVLRNRRLTRLPCLMMIYCLAGFRFWVLTSARYLLKG